MAFENNYPNRKDRRKPYYYISARCLKSFRCHGRDSGYKLHNAKKRKEAADYQIREYSLAA